MAAKPATLVDLPLDILVLIFPYLDARSFLYLCSTCKAFQQPSIRLDPTYWSFATRSTFRVPNQPVVQHDGERWLKMYRRLLTQSRVFTWGNNTLNRLGHSFEQAPPRFNPMIPRFPRPVRHRFGSSCSFPTEVEDTRNIGVIADMQCGGWSTTLLNSKGALFTAGVLDGMRMFDAGSRLERLTFPAGYPSSSDTSHYYEPTVAIRQFSAGRAHILGLSDDGKIWSWYHKAEPALQIKFSDIVLTKKGGEGEAQTYSHGNVRQVLAGWSRSSAYIIGIGIVVWGPVERENKDDGTDTMLVLENAEVPKTNYRRPKNSRDELEEQKLLGEEVGEVTNYILLEHWVVFTTDKAKVFCGLFGEKNNVEKVFELRALRGDPDKSLDIQGSFRRFAVFRDGEVITSDQVYLANCWDAQQDNPEHIDIYGLNKMPALQHKDVISIAFGDYHFLALHLNGKITAYGTEVQACGALGLDDQSSSVGRARGIVYDPFNGDGRLLGHACVNGRQVWFDEKRREWIHFLMQGGGNPIEAQERMNLMNNDDDAQGELSEWIEQEGRAWETDLGEDGLGAYFALRVSAAGWHSGALVLVNDELAGKAPTYSWEHQEFPRLRLSDGREMPGTKDFDEFRNGRPKWERAR